MRVPRGLRAENAAADNCLFLNAAMFNRQSDSDMLHEEEARGVFYRSQPRKPVPADSGNPDAQRCR